MQYSLLEHFLALREIYGNCVSYVKDISTFCMNLSKIRVTYCEKPRANMTKLISFLVSPCSNGTSGDKFPAAVYKLTITICHKLATVIGTIVHHLNRTLYCHNMQNESQSA